MSRRHSRKKSPKKRGRDMSMPHKSVFMYLDDNDETHLVYFSAKTYEKTKQTALVLMDSKKFKIVQVLTWEVPTVECKWDEIILRLGSTVDDDYDWLVSMGAIQSAEQSMDFDGVTCMKVKLKTSFILSHISDGSRVRFLRDKAKLSKETKNKTQLVEK